MKINRASSQVNTDLAVEVKRRLEVLMFTDSSDKRFLQMKPNNKKREALIEWLVAYPINEALCVEFLKKESFRVAGVLERAIAEEKETSLAIKHGAWTGQIPYLRLIHCITDCDATRHAFLHRNDVMSREELDAQGSSDRPKTGFETIAHKWNDPSFNPTTRISSCHDDFSIAHKALQQEKQLAVQKRIDLLRDQLDELEVHMDRTGREVYRQIINRKTAELRKLEEQLDK